MKVVISQSMYFPWVGMLEQIRQSDVFIHYDDVQFSKGSFTNRVQVKIPGGATAWMTVPLARLHLGQTIDAVAVLPHADWAHRHLALLQQSFEGTPFATDAVRLAEEVLAASNMSLAGLARASMMALCRYFGLDKGRLFLDAATMGIGGAGSVRVRDLVSAVGGDTYVTGHGARNYLDHTLLEASGIGTRYMDYQHLPYSQSHGAFTPFVTGLDLVAHCGRDGIDIIASQTRDWKEFIHGT